MKTGIRRASHRNVSIASRVMVGMATLAAGMVLLRTLPDLIRYLRARRM
jgi:hypothetical protein